jgi:benzoylformate decarboxylase
MAKITAALTRVLGELGIEGVTPALEHPGDLAHGDYATNVALAAAKAAKKNPKALADELVEKLGASVWFEGLRGRNSFPTDHPAYCGTLAFDAPGVARQLAGNDLVLMVGGPFFEEVWYAPGSPFAQKLGLNLVPKLAPKLAW